MKSKTFHWEIRTVLAMFEDAFNEMVVDRFDADRASKDSVKVNFKYSPKTRTLHEIVQKNGHFKMPVASITVGGIRRASERVFNKIGGTTWTNGKTGIDAEWKHLLQPVPIDLTVNMSMVARFQSDIDQMLTNFIPYCDPYIVVSWKWPDIVPWDDFEIRSHIKWNEDVSFEYPIDIANTAPYRVIANTSFTIESWMFKNSDSLTKPIYVVDTSFTSVNELDKYEVMKEQMYEDNTDYSSDYTVISGIPQFSLVEPYKTYLTNNTTYKAYGKMFDFMDALYVSSADWTMFDTSTASVLSAGVVTIDPMSATIHAQDYPPISGIRLPDDTWKYKTDSTMIFKSMASNVGTFDIIGVNVAGYGIMSDMCVRETTNPYPSGSDTYNEYIEYQHPCISGLSIV